MSKMTNIFLYVLRKTNALLLSVLVENWNVVYNFQIYKHEKRVPFKIY